MQQLRALRESRQLSQARLAELAGTSQPQIRRLESGQRKLTKEWAERLAPHLQVSARDLMFAETDDLEREVVGLPVLGISRAGDWLDISIMDEPDVLPTINVARDPRFPKARQYALRVSGDSMDELFGDGCFVTLVDYAETGLALRPGMIVHVEQHMGGTSLVETTLKQISPDMKALLPRSRNPVHKPLRFNGTDATEIVVRGIVTGKYEPIEI